MFWPPALCFLCAACNKDCYPVQIYARKRKIYQLRSPSKRKSARFCIRTNADFIKPVISSKTFSYWGRGRAMPVGHLFAAKKKKKHNIHKRTWYLISQWDVINRMSWSNLTVTCTHISFTNQMRFTHLPYTIIMVGFWQEENICVLVFRY